MAWYWTPDSLSIGGELSDKPLCGFDSLSNLTKNPEVFNYLDNGEKRYTPLKQEDMIKEIMKLHENCLWWDPILDDCEHVLAYVRYGTKQLGEVSGQNWNVFVECFTQMDANNTNIPLNNICTCSLYAVQIEQTKQKSKHNLFMARGRRRSLFSLSWALRQGFLLLCLLHLQWECDSY